MLKHPIFFCLRSSDIISVPIFEIGKFIIRRQGWMRLTIAFNLRHLVDRLPPRSQRRIIRINRLTINGHTGEHHPVGNIAIVCDGHHLAAGSCLVLGKRAPEILRITTRLRGERRKL